MNRMNLLLVEFGWQTDIPLEQVAAKYLGLTDKSKLSMKARSGQFPFPVFKADKSQKAPWLVNITDLAEYLDREYDKARHDWQQIHA